MNESNLASSPIKSGNKDASKKKAQTGLFAQRVKPFKKKANSTTVKFDPTPIAPMPSVIQDPVADELKQRLNKLVKDAEEEKLKDNSQGLAGLLGGII